VRRGEAEIRGGRDDVRPLRARGDAGDPALDVDLDSLQGVRLHQDHVVHRSDRLGVVSRPLGRDLHAARTGELDDRDHVGGVGRNGDERRLLDDRHVERLGCGVPPVPARRDHGALESAAQ
jgi:hypothetical protein